MVLTVFPQLFFSVALCVGGYCDRLKECHGEVRRSKKLVKREEVTAYSKYAKLINLLKSC